MKKRTIAVIMAVLMLSAVFVGCGDSDGERDLELLMATGGTAGTYYPLGGAIANAWSEHIDGVNVGVQSSGASVENMRLLERGEAELVMAMNNIAEDAFNGDGDFEQPVTNFKAVGVIYPEVMQIFARADSDINTISDLKGKRVAVGPPGSGTEATFREIVAAYGLSYDDFRDIQVPFGDAADQFKDGHIDVAANVLAVPAGAINDVITSRDIQFVEIDGEGLEALQEAYPLAAPYVIPGGTYDGVPEDANTVALQAVLYVTDELDEEVVYNLTKVMYEKNDEIARGHARGEQISIDNAVDGITTPLHPGAIRYYEEVGVELP
ncbi:hypothetical protein GGQ84_001997 [Desulfitispora alkaliphila]|uniref:TAXI family TRAP transporter solute-binding subunit n=1 Tax=Desulfitispora alkaliphila TaxID=622674 RepID=UPI003D2519D1